MKIDNQAFTILDGNAEEQKNSSEKFIALLTEEEQKNAMSDDFSYLDED